MLRVNVPKGIEACVSGDSDHVLSGIKVYPDKNGDGFVAATDGRHIAVVECDLVTDGQFTVAETIISQSLLAPPVKKKGATDEMVELSDFRWSRPTISAAACSGSFPRVPEVFSPLKAEYRQLRINRTYIANLTRALQPGDSDDITLFIPPASEPDSPVCVLGQRGIGLIMPMLDNGSERDTFSGFLDRFLSATKRKPEELKPVLDEVPESPAPAEQTKQLSFWQKLQQRFTKQDS